MAAGQRLLPPRHADRAGYERAGGYRSLQAVMASDQLGRETLFASNLTGLGGAHFPFARKAELALAQPGPRVVVCNAAEDEPGSQKDRTLITVNPHVVIEGALIAAAVLEASDVYFYISETLGDAISALTAALEEITDDTGLLGDVKLHTFIAQSMYVAGEASAAVSAINGGESKPLVQPPYPTDSGVDGKPTLVANCETLANLPRIVQGRIDGGPATTLTRLATVTGDVHAPGVFEIDPDADTIDDLIIRAGGLAGSGQLKAIQPGGPSSAFLGADARSVTVSNEAIRAAGSQPGCFAVRVVTSDRCMVEIVEELADFFRGEQCGQCPPCRMKTQTYHRTLYQIAHQHGSWDLLDKLAVVDEFVSDMPRRCALINMPSPPIDSARKLFHDDFAAHIDAHACVSSGAASPHSDLETVHGN